MFEPDAKPKMSTYAMISALIVVASAGVDGVRMDAGSQRVKVVAVHRAKAAIILLKRPNRSAT